MPLFPKVARTRLQPCRRGEKLFDFYNECARPGYDEFRLYMNLWLSEIPDAHRSELIARMRAGDREFQSGSIEIFVHAAFRRLGCDIEVHPVVENTNKRPDFGILDEGRISAYVEVTTVNPPAAEAAEKNREALIYNAIDRVRLPPGCLLGYDLVKVGSSSPSLGTLVRSIEEWAKENSEAAKQAAVTCRFSVDDWEVELDLLGGGSKEKYDHSIGVASGGVGWIAPHFDLRRALDLKSRKYGRLQVPYLTVVADAKGQLFGAESTRSALTEAVLGDEVIQFLEGDAAIKLTRANNGFWCGREAPRNTHVSGVMLFPDIGLWGLRSDNLQPVLAINPWAECPLPEALKVFHRFEAEGDKWIYKEGQNIGDILDLPAIWPPEE